MTRKIILDVDTGSDDAVAIMLAALHPEIELVAVCSVKGNQPLDNTTENTKRVLDLVKSEAPLYKGCKFPVVRDVCSWRIEFENRATAVDKDGKPFYIHQDFNSLKESDRKVEDKPAAVFYSEYFKEPRDTSIVAVGPLTNLATAILINPDIVNNVEELVIMGGGDFESNSSNCSEFNIFADPEAAQLVFKSGFKRIVLCPLDITHRAMVTKDDCARFVEIGTPAALFAEKMCQTRIEVHTQCQPLTLPDACALHDPLCVAYLIDPSVITKMEYLHVEVSMSGMTDGATIVDHRYFQDNRNVHVAYDGDRKKFVDIMCDAFKLSK